MNLKLYYQLWKTRRQLSPSSSFKRTLGGKLDAMWNERYETTAPVYGARFLKWSFAVVAAAVFMGGLSTGAYAYTSPEVTEGHPLYPLKRKIEAAEGKLYRAPERKARFEARQAERRKAEAAVARRRAEQAEKQLREVRERRLEIEQKLKTDTEKPVSADVQKELEKQKQRLEKAERKLQKKRDTLSRNHAPSAPSR